MHWYSVDQTLNSIVGRKVPYVLFDRVRLLEIIKNYPCVHGPQDDKHDPEIMKAWMAIGLQHKTSAYVAKSIYKEMFQTLKKRAKGTKNDPDGSTGSYYLQLFMKFAIPFLGLTDTSAVLESLNKLEVDIKYLLEEKTLKVLKPENKAGLYIITLRDMPTIEQLEKKKLKKEEKKGNKKRYTPYPMKYESQTSNSSTCSTDGNEISLLTDGSSAEKERYLPFEKKAVITRKLKPGERKPPRLPIEDATDPDQLRALIAKSQGVTHPLTTSLESKVDTYSPHPNGNEFVFLDEDKNAAKELHLPYFESQDVDTPELIISVQASPTEIATVTSFNEIRNEVILEEKFQIELPLKSPKKNLSTDFVARSFHNYEPDDADFVTQIIKKINSMSGEDKKKFKDGLNFVSNLMN